MQSIVHLMDFKIPSLLNDSSKLEAKIHIYELFQRGWGGVRRFVENPEGWGGHHFFQKTENPGRRGVPNEIPSVVGVWIFSGTAH